ncbi:MAG: hypothetical protein RR777_07005 [Christensenellaceae bacterium]
MDNNTHQNNRALWIYAQKLRLLLQSGIIDEKAYLGILEIAKKQLNTTLVLP